MKTMKIIFSKTELECHVTSKIYRSYVVWYFFNLSIPKIPFHTLDAEKKVTGCNNTAVTNNNEEGEMSSECSHHTGNYFKSIYINLLIQSLLIDILNGHTY